MKTFPSFNKSLLTAAGFLGTLLLNPCTGTALYAGPRFRQAYDTENSEMVSILGQISFNAMLCFISAIVLLIVVFIIYMVKTYTELSKPKKKLNRSFLAVLVLGLGTICSSCSTAQLAGAEQYLREMETEQRACPMNHHDNQGNAGLNASCSNNTFPNWTGPVFCKRCGKQIFRK
jgi:hypothetical protein